MRDIVDGLAAWRAAGHTFALATVVRTWHSAPRRPGAAMAVNDQGEALGSVSGGCVEAAVYAAAEEVLRTGKAQTQTYGVSDDEAFEVGLTCGGTIEVLVQPESALTDVDEVLAAIRSGSPVATASVEDAQLVVWPSAISGSLGDPEVDRSAAAQAAGMLAAGTTGTVRACDVPVFVQSYAAPPRMIVFGAVDFAAALCKMAKATGWRQFVVDPRARFATSD